MFVRDKVFMGLNLKVERIEEALEIKTMSSYFRGVDYMYSKKIVDLEAKINKLYEHLGIMLQEKCKENLPKIIKVKKSK